MTSTTDSAARYLPPAIVEQLLEINRQARQKQLPAMPAYKRLREFYTVSIWTARQTGNTQVIRDLATENDWVFVTNNFYKDLMRKDLGPNARIFTRLDFDGSVIAQRALDKGVEVISITPEQNCLRNDIAARGTPSRIFVDATSHFMSFQGFNLSHDRFFKELALFVGDVEIILLG